MWIHINEVIRSERSLIVWGAGKSFPQKYLLKQVLVLSWIADSIKKVSYRNIYIHIDNIKWEYVEDLIIQWKVCGTKTT
jgi:hypothetical protein